MARYRVRHALRALPVGLIGVFGATSAFAAYEAQVYGIAQFGGAGQCSTSDKTHNVHTSTAAAFRTTFDLLKMVGLWDTVHTHNNTAARGSYFTDASKAASCACSSADTATNYGVDEADVMYVHTHGGHSVSPAYSSLTMGNSSYDCSVRTDQNMLFGDAAGGGDLQIAVVKACQSADYDTWQNGGYRQKFTNATSAFTMWNGFHGNSSCGSHVTSYVGDYAAESINDGVGENWLDEAYDSSGDDDCPVSIVMGSSSSLRENMYEHGGWRDLKNTGNKTGSTYFYISGCNPSAGRTLPD